MQEMPKGARRLPLVRPTALSVVPRGIAGGLATADARAVVAHGLFSRHIYSQVAYFVVVSKSSCEFASENQKVFVCSGWV
jgi:hypothetical protein